MTDQEVYHIFKHTTKELAQENIDNYGVPFVLSHEGRFIKITESTMQDIMNIDTKKPYRDNHLKTFMHYCATNTTLKYLPKNLLKKDHMLYEDCVGLTPLDITCQNRTVKEWPKHLITAEVLTTSTSADPPIYYAGVHGCLNQLDAKLVASNLFRQSIPDGNLLCAIVRDGDITKIGRQLLTTANLTKPSNLGDTTLHALAEVGKLYIVENILRPSLLLIQDNAGNTVYHKAARYGHIDQIPSKYILPQHLALKNHEFISVFENIVRSNTLEKILGTYIPESIRDQAPEEWIKKNHTVWRSRQLAEEYVDQPSTIDEIEMF